MASAAPSPPPVSPSFDPAPGSRRRWGLLCFLTAGLLLSFFYRVSLAVISPELAREFQLSSRELGDLAAYFFYAFSLCQIPVGLALDRFGTRRPLCVLGLVAVGGALLFALAPGYGQAAWGRVLLGLGMSANLMGIYTSLLAWFPVNRFAFLGGIVVSLGSLGSLLAATPLALLAEALGWRGSFLCLAGLNLVQVAGVWLVHRDRPPGAAPPPSRRAGARPGLGQLVGSYLFWAASFASFVRYGFYVALQGLWATPFLVYGLGFDALEAANALLAMGLGYMIALPVSGRLSDRWLKSRRRTVWPAFLLAGLVCLPALAWPQGASPALISASFALFGALCAPGQIAYAHVKELVDPGLAARAMSGVNFFTMLGGAVFTQLLGWLLGGDPAALTAPGDYAALWWLGAGALILAALAYYFTPEDQALKG